MVGSVLDLLSFPKIRGAGVLQAVEHSRDNVGPWSAMLKIVDWAFAY